ncbi:MAG: choice-of-anchor tandem repeat GloVer-containing protein [Terriglobales bacterium]
MQVTKSTLAACMVKGATMVAVLFLALGAFAAVNVTYSESVIYPFLTGQSNPDGVSPSCNGLIMDKVGNLYGTTVSDGGTDALNPDGTVFKLTPAEGGGWTETILYVFDRLSTGYTGYNPCGTLAFDSKGNLYGTTIRGGDPSVCVSGGDLGCATVNEPSPTETGYWTPTLIYSFTGGSTDGFWPWAGVTLANTGGTLLYGTTSLGGTYATTGGEYSNACGAAFALTYSAKTGWRETNLWQFADATTGSQDVCEVGLNQLIVDTKGNCFGMGMYGAQGGPATYGGVYEISPQD